MDNTFINKLSKATGITSPYINELLNQLENASEKDKERIFKHISWHIPTGGSRMINGSKTLTKDEILNELEAYVKGENKEPETPDQPDEPEDKEVEVNEENFSETIVAGGDLKLTSPITTTDILTPTSNLNLNLNNQTVTVATGKDFIDVTKGIEVVVEGGTIVGSLPEQDKAESIFYVSGSSKDKLTLKDVNITGPRCVYVNNANDEVEIISGNFTTLYNSAPVVYVEKGGKVTIKGGRFQADGGVANKYLLNLKDALLQGENANKKATDYIEVFGGEFVNFDPSKSDSENPQVSFVAEGYTVEVSNEGDNKVYKVVPLMGVKKSTLNVK